MNKEQLHKFISQSTGNESNICQIYAIKDGETVFDDCWRGFKTDDAMNVNSVTKGIISLIAGISLDKGYIKSVDQKVMDFYPNYKVKRGEKTIYDVTVRHLLTMTAPYRLDTYHAGLSWWAKWNHRRVQVRNTWHPDFGGHNRESDRGEMH